MKNGKQFTSTRQPSGKAKARGWDRRRERLELMNSVKDLLDMKYSDFLKMRKDIESNPKEYTVKDKMICDYLSNSRYLIDWFDRILGKATQQTDLKDDEVDVNDEKKSLIELYKQIKEDRKK